jgi:hypothetical protein
MSQPLSAVRDLARALMDAQNPGSGVDDQVTATEQVLRRLAERLGPLVGTGGFLMLLQRALRRARVEHPWLSGVEVQPDAPWRLTGIEEAARGISADGAVAGAQALLAELIGLVGRFLGADMAIRLVRQSIPEWTGGAEGADGTEENIND